MFCRTSWPGKEVGQAVPDESCSSSISITWSTRSRKSPSSLNRDSISRWLRFNASASRSIIRLRIVFHHEPPTLVPDRLMFKSQHVDEIPGRLSRISNGEDVVIFEDADHDALDPEQKTRIDQAGSYETLLALGKLQSPDLAAELVGITTGHPDFVLEYEGRMLVARGPDHVGLELGPVLAVP